MSRNQATNDKVRISVEIPVTEYRSLEQAIQVVIQTDKPDSISQAEKDARICMFLKAGRKSAMKQAVRARLDSGLLDDLLDLPQYRNMDADELMTALVQEGINHSRQRMLV